MIDKKVKPNENKWNALLKFTQTSLIINAVMVHDSSASDALVVV